jgi:hypothetical protein
VSYRVVWRRAVRQRLDVLAFLDWERGDRSDRIPRAVEEIELRLALDPHGEGESRDAGERVLVVSPLTVWYEVFEASGAALIYAGRYFTPRRG